MDEFFQRIEAKDKGMGSISIFKNGQEVYQKTIGFADIKQKIKANSETKYGIGSISKTYTAVLILQQIEAKKLSLDTKLADFFPQLPNAKEISITHLLRHRSGLFNVTSTPGFVSWMTKPKTKEELIQVFIDNGTVFKPGEKFEYSNTNYILLSFILEALEEKSYADILREKIIKPLLLKNTHLGQLPKSPQTAYSYQKPKAWKKAPQSHPSIPLGAGAIVATPTDVNTFYQALFDGKLISKESLEQMKKIVDGYGFGLVQFPFHSKRAFGHTGGIDGFQSNTGYFPEDDVCITYTANGIDMPRNGIMIGALSIFYGLDYDLPEFKDAIKVKAEDLKQYIGVYASKEFPLKITISQDGTTLKAQATGQNAFPLEAYESHKFRFEAAGIKLEFKPQDDIMILNQGGRTIEFNKE